MNSSEDSSIFSLINAISSAQLRDKDTLYEKESNKMFTRGDNDFVMLANHDTTELGSTANSDKGSFGSESIDLNGGDHTDLQRNTGAPSFASFLAEDRRRESSNQSPAAIFGFSSSSSSSPPLSQTSEPSIGCSMMNDPICTVANSTTTRSNAQSAFSFNSLRANSKQSTLKDSTSTLSSPFATLPATTNPLDSHFSIFSTPIDTFSSFFDTPSTFGMTESKCNFNNQFHTSYSQDSLPQYFNQNGGGGGGIGGGGGGGRVTPKNTFGAFHDTQREVPLSGPRKFLLSDAPKTNGFHKTNSFANAFFFNEPQSPKSFAPQQQSPLVAAPVPAKTTTSIQTEFESNYRTIQRDICATFEFLVKGLQNHKEQVLKKLEQGRSTFMLAADQNPGSIAPPRIHFTHADIETLKNSAQLVLSSGVFAPCSVTSGEGLSVAYEGVPASFVVHTKNCFGEEVHNGPERVKVDIRAIGGIGSQMPIQKDLIDRNNGQYEVTYMIPQGKGILKIEITVTINSVPISNAPIQVVVRTRERARMGWQRISTYGEDGNERGKFCRPWGVALAKLPLAKDPGHKLLASDTGTFGSVRSEQIPAQSKVFYTSNFNSSGGLRDFLMAIADRSNNRVQLFKLTVKDGVADADISFLHTFGSGPGTLPGQFDRPAGVEINVNLGQIVVVDKDNHRVQVFDLSGNFLFKFGEKGSRPGQFCYPWDVAICPQTSQILISDTRNRRIQLFSPFGQYLWHCGQPLDSPRGLAFLTPEKFIVSDFNKHRLFVIDRYDSQSLHHHQHHHDSNSWAAIALGGAQNAQNAQNSAVSTVANASANAIISQMVGGKCIGFGEGSAWGEFLRPQGLVATFQKNFNGQKHVQLFCSDSRNNRIAVWDSATQNFDYINNTHTPFDRPSGIACVDNVLAVVDFGHNRVQIFQIQQ